MMRGRPDDAPPGPARDLLDLFRELQHSAQRSNGQIAVSTGLSRSYVSEVLNGRKAPSPDAAVKIASALGNNPHTTRHAQVLAEALADLKQHRRRVSRQHAPPPTGPPPLPHPVTGRGLTAARVSRRRANLIDPYVRRARLEPLLLCLLPLGLAGVVLLPDLPDWNKLWILVFLCLPPVMDQLVRDRGRQVEARLFARWGGIPTTRLLRWDGPASRTRQAHVHARVQWLVGPALVLPSEVEERRDAAAADDVYAAAVAVVRTVVRRVEGTAGLVFRENCNYGFRRNMLGLRPYGIVASALALAAVLADLLLRGPYMTPGSLSRLSATVIAVALLAFWLFVVTEDWVAKAAWIYAERLIETVTATL